MPDDRSYSPDRSFFPIANVEDQRDWRYRRSEFFRVRGELEYEKEFVRRVAEKGVFWTDYSESWRGVAHAFPSDDFFLDLVTHGLETNGGKKPVHIRGYLAYRDETVDRRHEPPGWRKLLKEQACRLCGQRWEDLHARRVYLTRHHLIPRREQGGHNRDNIVPLCRSCHDLVDNYYWTVAAPARAELRAALLDTEVTWISFSKGTAWFDAHYPLTLWSSPEPEHWAEHEVDVDDVIADQDAV